MSFSKRLKQFLESKNISQAEAARICGIAQQSMNYILKNDLSSSKLAPRISEALNINPEWLIYGHGRPGISVLNEIPILHSPYMLKKFIKGTLNDNNLEITISDKFIGAKAFAYLIKPNKMAICANPDNDVISKEFLTLTDNEITVSTEKVENSFPIFEWRERYEDF